MTHDELLPYDPSNQHTWCVEDQPETKMLEKGSRSMTDTELLSLCLCGMKDANGIAQRLYHKAGFNLHNLSNFSVQRLTNVEGLTRKKALIISAVFELGRRRQDNNPSPTPIKSSQSVYDLMNPVMVDLEHEEFWLITLHRANRVLHRYRVSQGGLSGTVIDSRIILKKALDDLASTIIVCHNHPSGNNQPSKADIDITKKLKEAAEVIEIKLLDHVIMANERYFSFADEGLIN